MSGVGLDRLFGTPSVSDAVDTWLSDIAERPDLNLTSDLINASLTDPELAEELNRRGIAFSYNHETGEGRVIFTTPQGTVPPADIDKNVG